MFYRTAELVMFRLDKVVALHPIDTREPNDRWVVRLDGIVGDEIGASCSYAEAMEIAELLEKRFGVV